MKFSHNFKVNHKVTKCWNFFQNIESLVQCIPGASLKQDCGEGKYVGDIAVSLGPFKAKFEGEAIHSPNNQNLSGTLNGKALDKKGGSRTKISLSYSLLENAESVTEVEMNADIQLSGPIAQFGRIGVIQETAKLLIDQFVKNAEKEMSLTDKEEIIEPKNEKINNISHKKDKNNSDNIKLESKRNNNSISIFNIIGQLIKNYFLKLFNK